jgi:hypothetical protein
MLPASGKFGLNRYVQSIGTLGTFDVIDTQTAKFVVTNASPGNVFSVRGKINGQNTYVLIDTLVGSVTKDIDITKFDYIEIECTTYVSQSTYVQIDGSGFVTSLANTAMGDINVSISLSPGDDGVYIGDKTTGIPMKVNNDGSINVNGTFTPAADPTLSLRFDEVSASVMYLAEGLFGALDSEAKWKIKKIEITGSAVSIKNASSDFDQIWNNRTSLIYV